MEKTPKNIDPAFLKMPRVTIKNKRWLLRLLSLLVSATRAFYRWSDAVIATTHNVQGSDNNRIKIFEIAPKTLSGEAPAIVYYHGGGFFMSYGRLHLRLMESYAEQLQVRVFFVQYRLSTQQAFPGPFNDCVSALDWVFDNAKKLQVNRERIAVMGDSAGGCLAAAVAQHTYDQNLQQQQQAKSIRAQLLIYPALDCDSKTESAQSFVDTPVWNAANNKVMWQVYLGAAHGSTPPPYASPSHRNNLSGLAAAYIETAEFDPLRDEAHAYADALTAAGVEVKRTMVASAVHGYDHVVCDISQNAKAYRVECMRALLCD